MVHDNTTDVTTDHLSSVQLLLKTLNYGIGKGIFRRKTRWTRSCFGAKRFSCLVFRCTDKTIKPTKSDIISKCHILLKRSNKHENGNLIPVYPISFFRNNKIQIKIIISDKNIWIRPLFSLCFETV